MKYVLVQLKSCYPVLLSLCVWKLMTVKVTFIITGMTTQCISEPLVINLTRIELNVLLIEYKYLKRPLLIWERI